MAALALQMRIGGVLDEADTTGHGLKIAGHILDDDETTALGTMAHFVIAHQATVRRGAFVKTKGHIGGQMGKQRIKILAIGVSALLLRIKTVGHQHDGVCASV